MDEELALSCNSKGPACTNCAKWGSPVHYNLSHDTPVILVNSVIMMCLNPIVPTFLWKLQIHQLLSSIDRAVNCFFTTNNPLKVVTNLKQCSHILNCMQKAALVHSWEKNWPRLTKTITALCGLWRESDSHALSIYNAFFCLGWTILPVTTFHPDSRKILNLS